METLPICVLKKISFYFTCCELCRLSIVNKKLKIIWSSDILWSSLNDFDDVKPIDIKEQYKVYLENALVMTKAKKKFLDRYTYPKCDIKIGTRLLSFDYNNLRSFYKGIHYGSPRTIEKHLVLPDYIFDKYNKEEIDRIGGFENVFKYREGDEYTFINFAYKNKLIERLKYEFRINTDNFKYVTYKFSWYVSDIEYVYVNFFIPSRYGHVYFEIDPNQKFNIKEIKYLDKYIDKYFDRVEIITLLKENSKY